MTEKQVFLLVSAFRYALGRRTTAPSTVVKYIKQDWDGLSRFYQNQIKNDIITALGRRNAGALVDETTWKEVLKLEVKDASNMEQNISTANYN